MYGLLFRYRRSQFSGAGQGGRVRRVGSQLGHGVTLLKKRVTQPVGLRPVAVPGQMGHRMAVFDRADRALVHRQRMSLQRPFEFVPGNAPELHQLLDPSQTYFFCLLTHCC